MSGPEPEDNPPKAVDTLTDIPPSAAATPADVPAQTIASTHITAPSAPPQDANHNWRDHPTNKEEWLNSDYITSFGSDATDAREAGVGEAGTMLVSDFRNIKTLRGENAYWQDTHINWALELIRRRYEQLEGVMIVPAFWSNRIYQLERRPDILPAIDTLEYNDSWGRLIDRLRNATIVVLPVNNGFQTPEENAEALRKANETIEKAKKAVEKANEEAVKAKDDAQKAKNDAKKAREDAKRADNEAKEAGKEGKEAEEAVEEARDAAKKAKEASQEKRSAAKKKEITAGEAGEALKKANEGSLSDHLGSGGHWSYIVVDKRDGENPRAHYVDSLVSPQIRNNKWTVAGIQYNGRAAGILLRGFDRLLRLPEHGFEAHTLKFIPHQSRNNACKADEGPCGPHIYAFLDHILGSKTTLIDPGMHTIFNVAASRTVRAREFNFNSLTARSRFAEELFAERKSYEQRRPELAVSNLTPGVLNSLMTADSVIYLAKGSTPRASDSNNNKNGNGNDNDDDGDDGGSTYGEAKIPKTVLLEYIINNPTIFKDVPRGDLLTLAYNLSVAEQAKYDMNTIYLGRHRYRNVPRDDTRIFPPLAADDEYKKPPGMTEIPDFETIAPPTLKQWVNVNFETKDQPDYESEGWEFACRARLHVMIKKSLLGQSDNILEELWSKDTAVFDQNNAEYTNLRKEFEKKKDKRPMYGVMREMLMRHYMAKETVDDLLKTLEKYKVKEPAAGEKRKKDGDDEKDSDDDDDEGGPDNSGNTAKRPKHSKKGAPGGSSSGGGGPGTKADGSGGSVGKHKKPRDFQTIANKDIDFLSMTFSQAFIWWQKVGAQTYENLDVLGPNPNLDFLDHIVPLERSLVFLHRALNGKFTPENVNKESALTWKDRLGLREDLGYDQILAELNTRTYSVPKLPKQIEWYPDYYLLERNITPAKKIDKDIDENSDEDDAAAGADPFSEHDGDPISGSSGSEDTSNSEDTSSSGDDNVPRDKTGSGGDGGLEGNETTGLHDLSHGQPVIPSILDSHNTAPAELENQDTSEQNNTDRDQSTQSKPEERKPEDERPHGPTTEASQSPTTTSNTMGNKRKHEGDSDSAVKKPKTISNVPKMPVSEEDESTKRDDANNNEFEDDNADITSPGDLEDEEDANTNELVDYNAENTSFDGFEDEGDEPGWKDAYAPSPSEPSSPSELSSPSDHSAD